MGVVDFDEWVTLRDFEAMDSAEVRVDLVSGARHVFSEAVVINPTGGPPYSIRLDCYGPRI